MSRARRARPCSSSERERVLTDAAKAGHHAGVLADRLSDAALARFATMVGLGSALTAALDLPAPDHDDWRRLIARLTDSVRERPSPRRRGS